MDSFTGQHRLSGNSSSIKVYDISQNSHSVNRSGGSHSESMSTSSTENQENRTSSERSQTKQFNLVKLFMKQKSMSNEGIVGIDQSDRSECWPSSSGGESGDSMGETKLMDVKPNIASDARQTDVQQRSIATGEDLYEDIQSTNIYNNRIYDDVLMEEEELGEDVDGCNIKNVTSCESETQLYATVNKAHVRRINVNSVSNSPTRQRVARKSCSSQSSATSVSISSCSESDGTQITRLNRLMHKDPCENKSTSTHIGADTVDKSMQTSSFQVSNVAPEKEIFKIVETSFLEKLKKGDCEKPVFILYPNYALPDISFLNGRPNIYLNPMKVNISKSNETKTNKHTGKGKRPFSCNDLETLKKKGLGHIKDWESLNFLLPKECKQILSEVPELMEYFKDKESANKCNQKYCNVTNSPKKLHKNRPLSCDCNNLAVHNTAVSSSSSTATQPSSGFRGSSTMLTDSSAQNSPAPCVNFNPLFVYRYDSATSSETSCPNNPSVPRRSLGEHHKMNKHAEVVPPRPPLPKSILRKSIDKTRKTDNTKRYSMFEMDELAHDPVVCLPVLPSETKTKRRSLQEPYYTQQSNDYRKNNDLAAKRLSQQFLDAADKDAEFNEYFHDEGVGTESSLESGKSNELKYHRPHTPPLPKPRTKRMEYYEFPPPGALINSEDLQLLEEFLNMSGVDCDNMDAWDENQVQKVRNEVSKFLHSRKSIEEDQKSTDSSTGSICSKKSVSFAYKSDSKPDCQATLKPVEELKTTSTPPNSPNISALLNQRLYQVII